MNMSRYVHIKKHLDSLGILVNPSEIDKHIDREIDCYVSTGYYDENHYKQFQETKKVKGFTNLTTDKIYFDFDSSPDNLNPARQDALTLIDRLQKYNISVENIEVFFSGRKGFNVVLNLKTEIQQALVANFAKRMAYDLKTYDDSLYDENQIIRIPFTKHQDSGLYKIPLSYRQLVGLDDNGIKTAASQLSSKIYKSKSIPVEVNPELFTPIVEIKKVVAEPIVTKPRYWKANLWAMVQGEMPVGTRDEGCLKLAAACRGLGYDEETAVVIVLNAIKRAWDKYGEATTSLDEAEAKVRRAYNEDSLETHAEEFDPTYGLVSLRELFNQPDVEIPYVIDKLLPLSGTSILAGAPKEGKSTLVRNLITAITNGSEFLSRKTMKGPIVYFALEENIGETKKNFRKLNALGSDNVHVAFSNHGVKGVEELEVIIDKYNPVLVVIDTLFHFVPVNNGNDYVEVNNKLKPYTNLARVKNVHIMFVHHTNKSEQFNDKSILGSQAIAGIVDTILLFKSEGKQRVVSGKTRNNGPLEPIYLDYDSKTNQYTVGVKDESEFDDWDTPPNGK